MLMRDCHSNRTSHLKYSEWIEPLNVAMPNTDTNEMMKQEIKNHAATAPLT